MTLSSLPINQCFRLISVFALLQLLVSSAVFAQTQFYPYYGKNRVKYDKFDWYIYETDHFEIYYYPELEQHLERVASYAESAYQHVSANLRHELAFPVPLVVFKTHSEFEQQNIIPGSSPEGVGAFAEPYRNRIALPIDEPPDGLYRLITHELTHIFEFDIIPRSIIRSTVPLWVDEGLADFMAGVWRPLDIMMVRDVAVSDEVPSMTDFVGYGGFANARVVYNLGHAVFDFMEERWGMDGVRQFLFALRRNAIGGGEDPYNEALDLPADDFDDAFTVYLTDRFEAFRDKERATDYNRNLVPDPLTSPYPVILSIESSPSGDLIAALALNRQDRELDILLLSSHSGEVITNLTSGFDQNFGFESISQPGNRFNTVPWLSWSPSGDQLAYLVRKGKYRALVIQNVVTRDIEHLIDLDMVDEPESPDFSPDGERVVFSGLENGVGDIFEVSLASEEVVKLTRTDFADYAPFYSPDGNHVVHLSRISGNNKLFRFDLNTGEQIQLTFGTHDDAGGQFIDNRTIIFASTAVDPTLPVQPNIARDGEIYNIWSLDLKTGHLRQLTDTSTGNVNPIFLSPDEDETTSRIGFVSYFKSEYGVYTIELENDLFTATTSDFGGPGPIIDFQSPLTHTFNERNARRKGNFENMYLESRPPINLGVTNSGDILGGTQVTFADVLGDQLFTLQAFSISQYRTYSGQYVNLSGRMQFAAQGFSSETFFYGFYPGNYGGYGGMGFLSRDDALATRRTNGGNFLGIYPFDRFRRIELTAGVMNSKEAYRDSTLQSQSDMYQLQEFGTTLFRDGTYIPLGIRYVQETTVMREFGPVAGNSVMFDYEFSPPAGALLSRQKIDVDLRYYLRLAQNGVIALRAKAFNSWGEYPDFTFFGGNSEMRGYDYLEFLGHKAFFANAELRFPIVEAMLTPIGVIGGIRGTFFFNFGAAGLMGQPMSLWSREPRVVRPITNYFYNDDIDQVQELYGDPVAINGFRLENARASYGLGLTTFMIGFPIHFDWSWLTLFNKEYEDAVFAFEAARKGFVRGSDAFRRVRFQIWIGMDF